jgi:hypothetical protein
MSWWRYKATVNERVVLLQYWILWSTLVESRKINCRRLLGTTLLRVRSENVMVVEALCASRGIKWQNGTEWSNTKLVLTGKYRNCPQHSRRHIQETEISKWLAAPRKTWERTQTQPYTSAAHQHQGNHRLMEGYPAWTEEMFGKNAPGICTTVPEWTGYPKGDSRMAEWWHRTPPPR